MIQVDLLRISEKASRDFSSESNLSKRKGPKWKERIRKMTPHLPNLLQYLLQAATGIHCWILKTRQIPQLKVVFLKEL